jgi:hypothetical protein
MHYLVNLPDVIAVMDYEIPLTVGGEDVNPEMNIRLDRNWPWKFA